MNNDHRPGSSKSTLISYIVWSVVAGLFLFFMFDELYFKICAFVIPIGVTTFVLYAQSLEKRQDKKATGTKRDMTSGDYFDSAEWKKKYISYQKKHPFKTPKAKTMREDLLKKCRKENFGITATFGLLAVGSVAGVIVERSLMMLLCTVVFVAFLAFFLKDYSGKDIKKWLDRDMDLTALEDSYMHGKMLTYKANGINLGTTHIICYIKQNIYAMDYNIIEDVQRRIVRVKNYENNIYAGDEYKHYAAIFVKEPDSDKVREIRIGLDEFQVQMVIDEFYRIKSISAPEEESV